jgi:hypothetical protein
VVVGGLGVGTGCGWTQYAVADGVGDGRGAAGSPLPSPVRASRSGELYLFRGREGVSYGNRQIEYEIVSIRLYFDCRAGAF